MAFATTKVMFCFMFSFWAGNYWLPSHWGTSPRLLLLGAGVLFIWKKNTATVVDCYRLVDGTFYFFCLISDWFGKMYWVLKIFQCRERRGNRTWKIWIAHWTCTSLYLAWQDKDILVCMQQLVEFQIAATNSKVQLLVCVSSRLLFTLWLLAGKKNNNSSL